MLTLAFLACPAFGNRFGRRRQEIWSEGLDQALQVVTELPVVGVLDTLEHEAPAAAGLLSCSGGDQLAPLHLEVLTGAALEQGTQQPPVIPTAPLA